jgi:polyhydroxybutyrate depolymerase
MSRWSRGNQRGPNPTETSPSANVVRLEYTGCTDDAAVVFYTIKGEGHQWPGGAQVKAQWLVGPCSHSIDATRQMWAFFREHPLLQK